MAGQTVVTVKDKQWSVGVANTYAELAQGLSEISSIPAGTGMLFDLGSDQNYIQIDMSRMLFPLDIIFINSSQGVVGVMHDIQPGETDVRFEATTPRWAARCFLEVNASEAGAIEVGDSVNIRGYSAAVIQPMAWFIPLIVGVLVGIMGFKMMKTALEEPGHHSSSSERQLGEPKTEAERREAHERKYGAEELPERGKGLEGHHSMWLTPEQREDLQEKYGTVAVRWAEEATKPSDIKGAEAAAEYYYGKLKEALGLGHLSPQLTEEQLRKLREVLGLTADVAEILKIHRETGYIP